MREDLVFHLVEQKEWKEKKDNSMYSPESIDSQGFIRCVSGENVEDIANRHFKEKENILLIVINTSLIEAKLKYEKDAESGISYPHIYGSLNLNAVIDKIELAPEEDGSFKISFSTG